MFILLNAIITPTARFTDSLGGSKRRATIKDGEEGFTLFLTSINNYKLKISQMIEKFYYSRQTIQPFIVVVGASKHNIDSFYVYLNGILYKRNSYIEAVDLCFKIFFVFKTCYPEVCKGPWTFIQKFFYEIILNTDSKQTAIANLINVLKI